MLQLEVLKKVYLSWKQSKLVLRIIKNRNRTLVLKLSNNASDFSQIKRSDNASVSTIHSGIGILYGMAYVELIQIQI